MKQYEAMFLFDPTFANNFANVETEIERIMERAGAEIIVSGKWDERKLAYDIGRRKRACYVLTYFRAEPDRLAGMERDCALSENILRVLLVRADGISRKQIDSVYPRRAAADRPESAAEKPAPVAVSAPPAAPQSREADNPKDDDAAAAPPVTTLDGAQKENEI